MKSYLSLIPIAAKVRKRQNRLTLLCIIFAVFLVTAIFSMTDMLIRMETMHTKESHGDWQIQIRNITKEQAESISRRLDIAAASWYDVVNLDRSKAYQIDGRQTVLCGIEEAFCTDIMSYFDASSSIQADDEIILTPNAKELLGVNIGSRITLNTPFGSYEFCVTGFRSEDSRYVNGNGGETTALLVKGEQIGAFMNIEMFRQIVSQNHDAGNPSYYVQFKKHANMRKAIREMKEEYELADADMEQNFILMGFAGIRNNTILKNIYPIAFVLFLLILLAGVLMISGSINSTMFQRFQFFGMMRCIGMSKQQVIRFVRLEALHWCKTAIPIGALLGMALSWGVCAVLRFFVGGEFSEMPVWGISLFGIGSGVLLGFLTVLIAAQSPAKHAAKVSPVTAVSGSIVSIGGKKHSQFRANPHILKMESILGVSHAVASKKNFLFMSGSYALSILLFLSFSVFVELLGCLLPTSVSSPDLSIAGSGYSNSIEPALVKQISSMEGVKHVFGRMYEKNVPAEFGMETEQNTVELISYEDLQIGWLLEDDNLKKGSDLSNVYGDNGCVLTIWDKNNPIHIGDSMKLNGTEVEIAGMLKYSPFSNSGSTNGEIILICSEETFMRLTGEQNKAILDIQMTKNATDEDAAAIRDLVKGSYEFIDRREGGDRNTFLAFGLFIYGFLGILAIITVLNIVNSISMSVSARSRQYGAMRAVGMDGGQLTRMIAAEASAYALTGCVIGCLFGLTLNKMMYDTLITAHFPYFIWSVPVQPLLIILLFVIASTAVAVYAPSKHMRSMAITESINEL